MKEHTAQELTLWLNAWSQGDQAAFERFMEHTYDHLRGLANRILRKEYRLRTITATELLHETIFKVLNLREMDWENRDQFYRLAVTIMKHLLVDQARRKKALRRGGDQILVTLENDGESSLPELNIQQLNDALIEFREMDPRGATIVELKFFVGLTAEEIAAHLNLAPVTVHRAWKTARAWLHGRSLK